MAYHIFLNLWDRLSGYLIKIVKYTEIYCWVISRLELFNIEENHMLTSLKGGVLNPYIKVDHKISFEMLIILEQTSHPLPCMDLYVGVHIVLSHILFKYM